MCGFHCTKCNKPVTSENSDEYRDCAKYGRFPTYILLCNDCENRKDQRGILERIDDVFSELANNFLC